MSISATTETNVKQAVPFFMVRDMEASLRFYVNGLGFTRTEQWVVDDKIRWCWLVLDGVALMLQEYRKSDHYTPPADRLGVGVSICFLCNDALAVYREFKSRGVDARRPFVGNRMWVTSLFDPDGYRLDFESKTDAPEESELRDE